MSQNRINNTCASCLGDLVVLAVAQKFPSYKVIIDRREIESIICKKCFKDLKSGSREESQSVKDNIEKNLRDFFKKFPAMKRQIGKKIK